MIDTTAPHKILNFSVSQVAWTITVIGAAHGLPWTGMVAIAAAVLWHIATASEPRREAQLIGIVSLLGFTFELLRVFLGDVAYTSGQPLPWLPPYWLVALWGLFAITLNVSLRWLHGRYGWAATLGLIGGPLSFIGGVRLGAARFIDKPAAIITLAAGWCVLMPVLVALATRFDGIAEKQKGE